MNQKKTRPPFIERVKAGLEEIILHAEGKIELKTYVIEKPDPPPTLGPADVTALRTRLRVTVLDFSNLLNVPLAVVRAWEQGKRKPSGAAARLLQIYSGMPDVVNFVNNGLNGKPSAAKPRRRARAKA